MKLEGMSAAEIQMKPEGATAAPAKPGGVATVAGGTVNAPENARTRFFLKVQDGCANRCAYCVIPQVRGKPMSIPAVEVQATAAKMVAAGYPELVVSGINAGVWHDGGMDLAGLMDWLARIDGLKRLRLSSIEVAGLTPELLDVMERHQNIGRHLHLPLQSGDDRVLAAMGRRYDTNAFTAAVACARDAIPGVNLTTEVIVGFPGENEVAFNNTLWLVEDLGFSKIHVFTYSPRPGTVAAAMGDTVPAPVKKRRSRFLRLLSDRQQRVHRQRKLGITSEILLESPLAPGVHGGYSSDYTRFAVEGGDPGMLVRVRGEEISGETVRGKVISD